MNVFKMNDSFNFIFQKYHDYDQPLTFTLSFNSAIIFFPFLNFASSIWKIFLSDSVHSWTCETIISAWLSHWMRESTDKYIRYDEAVSVLLSEKAI